MKGKLVVTPQIGQKYFIERKRKEIFFNRFQFYRKSNFVTKINVEVVDIFSYRNYFFLFHSQRGILCYYYVPSLSIMGYITLFESSERTIRVEVFKDFYKLSKTVTDYPRLPKTITDYRRL